MSEAQVWYHDPVPMTKIEDGSQSIDRAARILVRLVESDDAVSLSGLMEETQLPKTTAARLLRALERNGLAQRRRGGGFRPGPVLVEYARRDSAVGDLATLALPFLERLGATTGETANIGIPTPAGVARLAQVDSNHPLGSRQLGRPSHPDPRVVDGQGLHGFRCRPAPVRPPRSPRSSRRSPLWKPCSPNSIGFGGTATRRRGRSSTKASARPLRPCTGLAGSVIAAISVSAPTVRTSTGAARRCRPTSRRGGSRAVRADPSLPSGRSTRSHERRRDPPGSLRLHPGREQARGRGAHGAGDRRGNAPRDDAVRGADPGAGRGRSPLRARRLLRAGDADRRSRDVRRARAAASAACEDRRRSRSARS